jgi:hypothetical protein
MTIQSNPILVYCEAAPDEVRDRIRIAGGEIIHSRFKLDDRTWLEKRLRCSPMSGELIEAVGGKSALVLMPVPAGRAELAFQVAMIVMWVILVWVLRFQWPGYANALWIGFCVVGVSQSLAMIFASAIIQPRIRDRFLTQVVSELKPEMPMHVAAEDKQG